MKLIKRLYIFARDIHRQELELLWARKWDDAKKGMGWLANLPSISPVGWAVGYNYIYVMTRILNEMEPESVLDVGLGISSTLFSHYFSSHASARAKHTIVEHDPDWVKFYSKKNRLSKASEIILMKCVKKSYQGCEYNAYQGFKQKLEGMKYSVISIDAPLAGDKPYKHARRDIIDILPDALNDSFVIVIDDCNRRGEKATIAEIEQLLHRNGIAYEKGVYAGMSDCCVIASADNRFFCTM